jgi:predicted dehydrogenase
VTPRHDKEAADGQHPQADAGPHHVECRGDDFELVDIKVEDLASVLLRFENGAKGAFSVGQVCSGHKNDLLLEVCGSTKALRWRQEDQNELWIGNRDKANEVLQKDPGLVEKSAAGYVHLPGGHQEG